MGSSLPTPGPQPAPQALRRWISVTARLVLLGVVLSVVLIGFNVYKVVALRNQVHTLDGEIANRKQTLDTINAKLTDLNASYSKVLVVANTPTVDRPVFEQIQPKAKAVPVGNQNASRGTPLYDFTVWLDAPDTIRRQIDSVSYTFDHPSFQNKTQVATDATNGFAVSYRGWGALRLVTITVRLKNGTTHSYYFDMIKALGWDSR